MKNFEKIKDKFIFSKTRIIIFVILLIIISLTTTIYYVSKNQILKYNDNDFLCVFADVNQGESIIMKLPDGKIMIIDSGDKDDISKRKFKKVVDDFMEDNYVIDYLILTHSDNDHCSGIQYLFENYKVKEFYRPKEYVRGYDDMGDDYKYKDYNSEYINAIYCMSKEVGLKTYFNEAGIKFGGENYSVEFLAPLKEKYSKSNEYSAVIMLNVYDKKFLFTGDIGSKIESEIIGSENEKIDVLKVAHHGSSDSSSKEFLEYYSPDYAVISCKENNSYGFPSAEVLLRLEASGMKRENIFLTYNGNVIFKVNENRFDVGIKDSLIPNYLDILFIILVTSVILFAIMFTKFKNPDEYKKPLTKLK